MKKTERKPRETGSQWLNGMCEVLKGGVLAGVVTILALLVCAVLFGLGYFGCFQRKMVLNLLSGLVLSVLISLLGADAAAGGAMTCLLLASAYVTFEMDEGEVINV